MKKGDKLVCKKNFGNQLKKGMSFRVTDINTEDEIVILDGHHIMSMDGWEKYFEIEKIEIPFSKWEKINFPMMYIDGSVNVVNALYRYNKNRVELKLNTEYYYDAKTYKSRSSCHPTDKFNLKTGLDLAIARMKIKMMKDQLKNLEKSL